MRPIHFLSMSEGFHMKLYKPAVQLSCLLVFLFFLSSCVPQTTEPENRAPAAPAPAPVRKVEKEAQLPVQYQKPSYVVDVGNVDSLADESEDVIVKVGASIRSTQGPQPLWDILKRLAALKKMSVSWASDVDQNVLVDVDISAGDDFYAAIDNLLRQVDYYHEVEGSTIIVHYKETRQFHVAMPFTKQLFETATGGNVLGSNDASSNIEGTIRLDSRDNQFDIWMNIQDNMDAILDTWSTTTDSPDSSGTANADSNSASASADTNTEDSTMVSRQVSASGNRYTIDKPIGLITVHAPRPLLDKLEVYFDNLKHELYKQISIEAKILEVQISDKSSIGLNWNLILKNLAFGADGRSGKTRTHTTNNDTSSSNTWTRAANGSTSIDATGLATTISDTSYGSTADTAIGATTSIVNVVSDAIGGTVSLAAFSFDSFLNVVQEQGETTILANPKLSVMNGQPALITVGRNSTYIDSIESDVNNDTGTVSYTVNTERVLSGVGLALTANILNDKQIIMNIVPVTSELEEPIEYRQVGAGEVGLPIINIREMSTTVKVKDGEMLVIGGLIASGDAKDGTFVPGLGSIPGLRYLFGYEEKTNTKRELIILLKPRII